MLIKVKCDRETRSEVIQIADIFHASIAHVEHEALVIEFSGTSEKLDAFTELMSKFGIVESARAGKVALARTAGPTEDLPLTTSHEHQVGESDLG
jgi:acetolactate synthase-1/3 small subunit